MHLKIRLFASCAEAVGHKEISVATPGKMTIKSLKKHLAVLYPELVPILPTLAFAINGESAKADSSLRDGDEVSVLPPVSGG